jgi:type I restriction enzyme S subunit
MELTATKFKPTEVGLIPEDWENIKLGEKVKITSGDSPSKFEMKNNGIPYYKVEQLNNSLKYTSKTPYFISHKLDKKVAKGSIIFPKRGASIMQNKIRILNSDSYFDTNLMALTLDSSLDFEYLFYVLSYFGLDRIADTTSVPQINNKHINPYQIPLPPTLNEQKAIAQVLSDTDALIQALEKKIAKKKLIKKGVMQKLLTPKEDWIESKVASIGQPYGGMSGKTKADFSNGNAHYVPFMNVMSNPITDTGYLDSVKINKGESQNKIIKGDLLFNGSSETPEEVGFCSAVLEQIDNLYLNSFCFGFRIFNTEKYDSLFLAYFFRSKLGRNFFYSLAQGATRYNLSKTNFLKSILALPAYDTQVQIATVIRDMDSEINNLEQKLSKYQLAKQGMMQKLLTGKIRLV